MRITALFIAAFVLLSTQGFAQGTSSVSYSTPDRGGVVIETAGGSSNPPAVGYARVQPSASTAPAGAAIYDLRQNGVLVAEAAVPGMTTMAGGRIYAEVNSPINTGIAIANPNSTPVTISFNFTDQNGNDFGQSNFTLAANAQIARFLSDAPFRAPSFAGTFTFNASAPVGVISLRTLVNTRGEFLIFTQTVTPMPDTFSTSAVLMGHFADGGGWATEVNLVNTTDGTITGNVQFFGEGSPTLPGTPLILNVNSQVAASFAYSIRPRSSTKLTTAGSANSTQVGSIHVTPDSGSAVPATSAVFSFSQNGVVVARSAVPTQLPGIAFRSYVEVNSAAAVPAAIQS